MANIYLQLEASTGNLYEYSKTEKEGFEKHESVNPTSGVKTISYRRYHKEGAFGSLVGVSKRESDMAGKKVLNLSIALDAVNGDRLYINFPLYDQRGDFNSYATSFLAYLPALKIGSPYRVFPYVLESTNEGKTRKSYGVSVKHARLSDNAVDDMNKIARLTFETEKDGVVTEGDIPRTLWSIVADKPKANNDNRNTFLWELLKKYETEGIGAGSTKKTFDSTQPDSAPVQAPQAAAPVPSEAPNPVAGIAAPTASSPGMVPNAQFDAPSAAAVATEDDDDDDLPF